MKSWLPDELAAVGFILTAMVGGFVGFLKAYEQAGVQITLKTALWGIFRRLLMGAFAGFLIYQLSTIYGWSSAWTHVLSGVAGIFASEFFEVLWAIGRHRLNMLAGKNADKQEPEQK